MIQTTIQKATNNTGSPIIAIVAGEVSGDILGAGLIKSLKKHYPNASFVGIAGQYMQQQGCISLFNLEELSVMGLVEVLKHLPRLLTIRRQLIKQLLELKPDIYIGIDAPDFNLDVEMKLKQHGIKTIHYVSPSVWSWRQKRIFKIAKATNLVLALLPFEKAFYDKFNVPCKFVGHTMADAIALEPNKQLAYQKLNFSANDRYMAILPGSRLGEIELLTAPFLQAALLLKQQFPELKFVVPLINQKCEAKFLAIKQEIATDLELTIVAGTNARDAMTIAEVTLLASGTATLECMLCKSPMVVAYKLQPLTYWIGKRLIKTKYISLPNLLANAEIVPELIQADCEPELLAKNLAIYLHQDEASQNQRQLLIEKFTQLHKLIRCNADDTAAASVIEVLENAN